MTLLTKQIIIFILILLLILAFVVAILWYHKLFRKIVVKESAFRPLNFIYKHHKGDYQKNMIVMEELLSEVKDKNIPIVSAATIYYDNPKKTKKANLRSDVGFIVPDSIKQIEAENVKLKTISHQKYIYTAFPYVSRFSLMLGAMRVYPAFHKKLKKLNKPEREIIEIYEMQNKTIIYLMPVEE